MNHFLLMFSIFSLCLLYIWLCVLICLFDSILLEVCWASKIFILMSFIKCEKSIDIISASILYCSLHGTPTIHMLAQFLVSHRSFRLCLFFFNIFSSYFSDWEFQISWLQGHWFFLLPAKIYLWIPLGKSFISVVALFRSRISFWFLSMILKNLVIDIYIFLNF